MGRHDHGYDTSRRTVTEVSSVCSATWWSIFTLRDELIGPLRLITGKGVNLTGLLGGHKRTLGVWGTEVSQRGLGAEPR